MFEWPIGVFNIIMLVGWVFILVVGRLKGVSYGARHWRLSGITLLLATLSLLAIIVFDVQTTGRANETFDFSRTNLLFALTVLLFSVLGHINFRFDQKRLELELAPISVMATFLSVQLIFSNNLLIYATAIPALFLNTALSTFSDRDTQIKNLSSIAIGFAILLLIGISLSIAFFASQFGTIQFSNLASVMVPASQRYYFLIAWAIMVLVQLSLFSLPPLDLVTQYYLASGSWSVSGYFLNLSRLTGVILVIKWIQLLEASPVLGSIFADGWPGSLPRLGVSLGLVVSIWSLFVLPIYRRISNFVLAWGLSSMALIFLATGLQSESARSWQIVLFFQMLLAIHLITKTMIDLRIEMKDDLSVAMRKLSEASPFARLPIFLAFLLMVPGISVSGYSVLKELMTTWAPTTFYEATSIQIAVVWAFFLIQASVFSLSIWLVSSLFRRASQGAKEYEIIGLDRIWSALLLFPLIIVGIYPTPLYNYVLAYLSK